MIYHTILPIIADQSNLMATAPPLIVTVTLDKASHVYFTELRNRYFPAYCNFLEAHLTFFHRLPSSLSIIDESLRRSAERTLMNLEVTGIKNIGNGVVFNIISDELQQLHKDMQRTFDKYLITQDRKKLRPHITVQNKVTAYKAKQTMEKLSQDFKPFAIQAIGFNTWLYLKGPWQKVDDYLFTEYTS
jgi:hypothetical protein